jgi:hypothetical protein
MLLDATLCSVLQLGCSNLNLPAAWILYPPFRKTCTTGAPARGQNVTRDSDVALQHEKASILVTHLGRHCVNTAQLL